MYFKKVAIIYANDNALTTGEDQISWRQPGEMDPTVVDTETFATADKDFSRQLTKIKGAHPDVILCGALAPAAVPILVQARQLASRQACISSAATASTRPPSSTAPAKRQRRHRRHRVVRQWYVSAQSAVHQSVQGQLRESARQFAAQAFDGVNIVAAAIKAAHTTSDRTALRDALATLKSVPVVTGATGTFHFTNTRDAGERARYRYPERPIRRLPVTTVCCSRVSIR